MAQLEAYIGLGMGNTQFFMAASVDPNYFNEKVNLLIALAPTVQIHRTVDAWTLFWQGWEIFFMQVW